MGGESCDGLEITIDPAQMSSSRSFFARLTERVVQADSLLCIGLDPHPELLSETSGPGARDFCLRLIETTAEHACAFKPNSAFFEAFGAPGWAALREVIGAVPDGIPVILDAKRGDIASTSEAYVRATFEWLGADAVTISPYLGHDAVAPFTADPAHGVFLLCKTSNPGSENLQTRLVDGEPLYVHVARLAGEWNRLDNLGLVVGATDPRALASVRNAAPDLWILAPGVGPQGGDLGAAVRAGLREDGLGLIVPISRALVTSGTPAEAARRLRDQINQARTPPARYRSGGRGRLAGASTSSAARAGSTTGVRGSKGVEQGHFTEEAATLADALLDSGCVRFGDFELKSGGRSPIYFDLRQLVGSPGLLSRVASSYLLPLARLRFDRLAAVPYAGLPIATAVSLQSGHPLVYPRKETKDYGTGAAVEGGFEAGETVVVLDDVATTAASKFEAIERLTAAGLIVRDVVVLIDREGGARHSLAQAGYTLHAVFTLSQLLDHWKFVGTVGADYIANVREFMARGKR